MDVARKIAIMLSLGCISTNNDATTGESGSMDMSTIYYKLFYSRIKQKLTFVLSVGLVFSLP